VRIRFAEPGDEEQDARSKLLRQVDLCIAQLAGHADFSSGLPPDLAAAFEALEPRLALSLIDGNRGPRLCVSSRGRRELDGLVGLLCDHAEAAGLVLQGHATPMRISDALTRVRAATGYTLDDARVRVGFGRGHLLEISVLAESFPSTNHDASLNAAECLVESVLGERVLDHWVRTIHCGPLPRQSALTVLQDGPAASPSLPLEALSSSVSAAIEGLVAGLPELPLSGAQLDAGWTMFEIEPELASDYWGQDDVAVATTMTPELLKCFLERAPFSSLRFSRHGETFAYLKVEAIGDSVERLKNRQVLEDTISAALGPGIGCVIGNGLGIRYLYIDLALEDVARAIEVLRAACAERLETRRAWLLFCDSQLALEWVGMHRQSPPPPLQHQATLIRRA
jgi:hypothetical protein